MRMFFQMWDIIVIVRLDCWMTNWRCKKKKKSFSTLEIIILGRNPVCGSNLVRGARVRKIEGLGGFIVRFLWDKPAGFGRVRSLVFLSLGLGLTHFLQNRFENRALWRGSKGFKIRFWWMNLSSIEFVEVRPINFEVHLTYFWVSLLDNAPNYLHIVGCVIQKR